MINVPSRMMYKYLRGDEEWRAYDGQFVSVIGYKANEAEPYQIRFGDGASAFVAEDELCDISHIPKPEPAKKAPAA